MKRLISLSGSILLLAFLFSGLNSYSQTYSGYKVLNTTKNVTLNVVVDSLNNTVDIIMTGPHTEYYSIGFGKTTMTNCYAILKAGSGTMTERKLGNHTSGTSLSSSFTSSKYTNKSGIGTVKLSLPRIGKTTDHYTFANNGGAISIIWAYGNSSTFKKHISKGSTVITLTRDCTPQRSTIDVNECSTYKSPSGKYTWNKSGKYQDTITNSAKTCDSIITVNLSINSSFSTTKPIVCDSLLSPGGTKIWRTSGTYFDIIKNHKGCDSAMSIILTVLKSTDTTLKITECYSYTTLNKKYTWTKSGIYHDTLLNQAQCDSFMTFDLTITNNTTTSKLTTTECESYLSPSGKYLWTKTGNYIDTTNNSTGCDSIITINLTIYSDGTTNNSTITETVCDSYLSPSGRTFWKKTGTFKDTINSVTGCDSIITINLTVLKSTTDSFAISVCDSFISPSGNYTWKRDGIYQDTIPNYVLCDSIITVNLAIVKFNLTITNNDPELIANDTTGSYQWLNCSSNYSLLPSETNRFYTSKRDGQYAVEITKSGCIDTSVCEIIGSIGILENTFKEELTIFPNPTNGELVIELSNLYQNVTATLYNISGEKLKEVNYRNSLTLPFSMNQKAGIYLLIITNNKGEIAIKKVVKY